MRVVPGRAVLGCVKRVDKLVTGGNGTLCYPVDAVGLHVEPLADAVLVDASAIC